MPEDRDARNEDPGSGISAPSAAEKPVSRRDDEDGDEFPGLDSIVGTFISEPSLWPVLIVALGSGGAFGAAMLILAIVDRNPFAAAALLLIAGMSIDIGLRARKKPEFRNIAKAVILVWCAALAFAALAIWTGIAFG